MLAGGHLVLVEEKAREREFVAVEHKGRRRIGARPAMEDQPRLDLGVGRIEFKGEIDAFENEIGRTVVGQLDDFAFGCTHKYMTSYFG